MTLYTTTYYNGNGGYKSKVTRSIEFLVCLEERAQLYVTSHAGYDQAIELANQGKLVVREGLQNQRALEKQGEQAQLSRPASSLSWLNP